MIKSVELTNIGGLDHFKFDAYPVTIIEGENGKGKTTILESIGLVLGEGADRELLKQGSKKGSVVVVLDNGYIATKTIDPANAPGYSLVVEDPNGGRLTSGAATLVKEWTKGGLFDARGILDMVDDPKALEKFLLKYLPLEFSAAEFNAAAGGMATVSATLTLPELNAQWKRLYDERTENGRDVKALQGAITTMEKQLPDKADDPTDWGKERDRLTGEVADMDGRVLAVKKEIRAKADELLREKTAEIERAIQALRDEFTAFCTATEAEVSRQTAECVAELTRKRSELVEQLGLVRGRAEAQTGEAALRNAIQAEQQRLQGHVTKETKLTMAINAIDALKTEKLRQVPVKGLDIRQSGRDIVITIDGIPLDKINTQKQIFTAVQFLSEAQKAAGCELRLLILDNAEALSRDRLIELGDVCVVAGIQLIASIVRDKKELRVVSLEEFRGAQ